MQHLCRHIFDANIQLVRVRISRYTYGVKCKLFQSVFWQTLPIAYRLGCDDEVAAKFREGLEWADLCRLAKSYIRIWCRTGFGG